MFAIIFFVLIFWGLSLWDMYQKSSEADVRNKTVQGQLDELRDRKIKLEGNINDLETNLGVEEELRRKFQIKRPGEEFIVIVDESPVRTELDESGDRIEKGRWERVKEVVKKLNIFKKNN